MNYLTIVPSRLLPRVGEVGWGQTINARFCLALMVILISGIIKSTILPEGIIKIVNFIAVVNLYFGGEVELFQFSIFLTTTK